MRITPTQPKLLLLSAALAMPLAGAASAQELVSYQPDSAMADAQLVVTGLPPADLSGMDQGPDVDGFISARRGEKLQITTVDGSNTSILISEGTTIKSTGGFLGLSRNRLESDALLNGLPVSIETVQWGGNLVASEVELKSKDLKTASMIRNGTEQRFGEQGAAISQNAAATEALRGRFGDIDQYNVKGTTNVYFDTGKHSLSARARNELCSAAAQAGSMDNALLLVVGYTDSTGSYEVNQALSERRAGRVVNYLQQQCGWKPYRMLTPTGMAEADPAASNATAAGKAQNRRVAVNILVSKSVDGY
ncbi:OmpA family protein [Pontixanthobacter aquaemixtae]|uniref:OmpA family protein n=1 Tax=Pontixanthobacter aquaemixtae TaxID=1958940 RepID=A0A844ZSJ8_9SPHN|nr:OmpA family protein [Pontixanthobacter aquaemixtae]MXO90708.1 OmpA family protein [Pontixanthobacter aquaemixtae]